MSEWVNYFEETNRTLFMQCLRLRRLIELIIRHTPEGGRILEVGCGTGSLSLLLDDYGFEVTASDISREVLDYARKKTNRVETKLKFVQADLLNLSYAFKKKQFDTVCHKGVMEHFNDKDIVTGLGEQRKIARKVIFHVPNNRQKTTNDLFGDERLLSNRKWVKLIMEAGFTDVRVFGDYDLQKCTYILPAVFLRPKLSFWWKYLSKHSVFVCK
ncbi:MAG: class I SAM-dependent methyltransferase [Methanobacteriota archaeon]